MILKSTYFNAFLGAALLLPVVAFAQGLEGTLEDIQEVIGAAIPVIIGLALLFFLWGVATFILSAGEDDARKKGRQMMLWGIISLFVIVAVWGIVNILVETLGVGGSAAPEAPEIPS